MAPRRNWASPSPKGASIVPKWGECVGHRRSSTRITPARHKRATQNASGKVIPTINSEATEPKSFIRNSPSLAAGYLCSGWNTARYDIGYCNWRAKYAGHLVRPLRVQLHGVANLHQLE